MPPRTLRVLICTLLAAAAFEWSAPRIDAAPATFKLAFWNIKSGNGESGFDGTPTRFTENANCTDPTTPLNAWGVGLVQSELLAQVEQDPAVVALGLAEAWECARPAAVQQVLGWPARTASYNGTAIIARFGFAASERWVQLDTSRNVTPADSMWVIEVPVCLDAACSASIPVFAAHWLSYSPVVGSGDLAWYTTYDIQADQTLAFMAQTAPNQPHVLIGDLNVWEGTTVVCDQFPTNRPVRKLRAAGYVDAWQALSGLVEGYTGMWNRAGCGIPEGYLWKRIDHAWSRGLAPLSMRRFGMTTPGYDAPSDHAGIVVEYPIPAQLTGTVPPQVSILAPYQDAEVAGAISIQASASDDAGVQRVELLVDGVTIAVARAAPFTFAWDTSTVTNGPHTLAAAATDVTGNRTVSATRTIAVTNPIAAGDEVVLHAAEATLVGNAWQFEADATAASGFRAQNADAGTAAAFAAATPASYLEFSFVANAGKPYRLWIRGRALQDSPTNDSIFVQFDNSVSADGTPVDRIASNEAVAISLDECTGTGCGLSGWGWRDNGLPQEVIGLPIYFRASGPQRMRIQAKEDGLGIDEVVLSAVTYRWSSPGTPRSDTVILPASSTGGTVPPPTTSAPVVSLTSPADGATFTAPATMALTAAASDADGTIARVEFYQGATLIGTDVTSPYAMTWSGVAAGTYTISARAVDNLGATTISSVATVTVYAGQPGLPDPWAQRDIGAVVAAGSGSVSNGAWSVAGSGADIWGTADQFHFLYRTLTGDGEIIARVATVQNVNSWTKAGVMVRASLASDAAHAFMLVTPGATKGLAFQRRPSAGGISSGTSSGGAPPSWVRLSRSGATVTAYRSSDGVTWTTVGSDLIALGATAYVGLALTSHDTTTLATATFDNVSVVEGLPTGWAQRDVGSVGVPGNAAVAAGTWTVTGSGADVWGTADQFHFVYQPLAGDGAIVARVASVQNVNAWTKAGVMFRSSLADNSAYAFMLATPGTTKGLAFQWRNSDGASAQSVAAGGAPPVWVRLARAGSTVTASTSADGITWASVGSGSVAFGTTVLAGLAVSSHVSSALASASFDQVQIAALASSPASDVVLYAAEAPTAVNWTVVSDSTAAGGRRLQNVDAGAPKVVTASSTPGSYFELTFSARANQPYRLWIRGQATGNSYVNDSVFVQFDASLDGNLQPAYRIGTSGATEYNLEECSGCGLSTWGWQDNGWGAPGLLGPVIYFDHDGVQRIRIQVREDGLGIDQVVLSSNRWLNVAPGAAKNDTTILPKQ